MQIFWLCATLYYFNFNSLINYYNYFQSEYLFIIYLDSKIKFIFLNLIFGFIHQRIDQIYSTFHYHFIFYHYYFEVLTTLKDFLINILLKISYQ